MKNTQRNHQTPVTSQSYSGIHSVSFCCYFHLLYVKNMIWKNKHVFFVCLFFALLPHFIDFFFVCFVVFVFFPVLCPCWLTGLCVTCLLSCPSLNVARQSAEPRASTSTKVKLPLLIHKHLTLPRHLPVTPSYIAGCWGQAASSNPVAKASLGSL